MLACAYAAFDRPMILFQNVAEILHRSMAGVLLQSALGFELLDGRRVSCILIGVDDPRCRMILDAQGFSQKAPGRRCIAFGRQKKSMVAPLESTARYK
jgi:hypothetical protein